MATTKKTIETKNDTKDKVSIIEIIQDIDARLTHLEDIQMDNRDLTVKLVKQGNTVVEFLKDFQIEPVDMEDLEEFHSKCEFIKVTNAGVVESKPHLL